MKATRLLLGSMVCLIVMGAWTHGSFAEEQTDDELIQMVVDLLSEKDKDLRALGLEQVRTAVKGQAATQQFAALLLEIAARVPGGVAERSGRSRRSRRAARRAGRTCHEPGRGGEAGGDRGCGFLG